MTAIPRYRHRLARRLGWLAVAGLLAASFSPSVLAGDKTEITICHGDRRPGQSVRREFARDQLQRHRRGRAGRPATTVMSGRSWFPGITVTWGDIIPPYDYEPPTSICRA